jgi:inorganic pyrophosphatase
VDKLTPMYRDIESPRDLPQVILDQIAHFFAHYKDLEPASSSRSPAGSAVDEAKKEIMEGVHRYREGQRQAGF